MKHIKVYEAFDSNLLNKTSKFLKKNNISNKEFLNRLRDIFNDKLLSKLSDDDIKYMSAKNALNYTNGNDIILKFWFSLKDGFIESTKIDKNSQRNISNKYGKFNKDEINFIKNNFVEKGSLYQINGKNELKTGDKIIMICKNYNDYICFGTFFEKDGIAYLISDNLREEGNTPSGGNWRQYGSSSWSLSGINDTNRGDFNKLTKYVEGDNPLEYKTNIEEKIFNLIYNPHNEYYVNYNFFKDIYNRSDFALVINLSNFEKKWESRKTLTAKRIESRKDALALTGNKEIKNKNIERYINTIFSNIEKDNYKNINKVVLYSIGYKFGIYSMYDENLSLYRKNLIDSIYNLLNNKYVFTTEDQIVENIKGYFISMYKYYTEFQKGVSELEKICINSNIRKSKELKEIITTIRSINDTISQYLINHVENIDDISIVLEKFKYIKSILDNRKIISEKVIYLISHFSYISTHYNFNRKKRWVNEDLDNYIDDAFIKNLEKIQKIIKEVF